MLTTSFILWALVVPLIVVLGVILWITEDRKSKARRWRRAGLSQRAIAERLHVSRATVRRWIA